MTRRRQDRWLLLRLAAQNVGRGRLRALFLGAAVMLGVGIGFACFVAGWSLREGAAVSFARMGADLVVVPRGTLVNITAGLLTVQPTAETMPADLDASLLAVAGIANVAPQRLVPVLVDGKPANLIAFDPAHDFSVQPWLRDRGPHSLPVDGIIAGGRLAAGVGDRLAVCGLPLTVHGRLGNTGVGPFDGSYFVSFATLGEIVAYCRSPAAPAAAAPSGAIKEAMEHAAANACPPDLAPERVTAFLVRLTPGAKPEAVKFAISQLPAVKVVEGNTVLTASRQALGKLLTGIALFAAILLATLWILIALLFSAIVQERSREIGLLRALGARPGQVTSIILGEAAIITGLGGVAGLVFGAALLVTFARSLGHSFNLIGIPYSWPPAAMLPVAAVATLAVSAMLGVLGAVPPAWRLRRIAPHALIQGEGR